MTKKQTTRSKSSNMERTLTALHQDALQAHLDVCLERYGLQAWEVLLDFDFSFTPGHLGDAEIISEYRQAKITLYTNRIMNDNMKFVQNSLHDVLEHEVCEIVVAEICLMLPEEQTETEEFMRFRDVVAERIRQSTKTAMNQRKK